MTMLREPAPGTAEYRYAYERGWRASKRESFTQSKNALDRASDRNEIGPWYDGYLDHTAGREKWHLMRNPAERAL